MSEFQKNKPEGTDDGNSPSDQPKLSKGIQEIERMLKLAEQHWPTPSAYSLKLASDLGDSFDLWQLDFTIARIERARQSISLRIIDYGGDPKTNPWTEERQEGKLLDSLFQGNLPPAISFVQRRYVWTEEEEDIIRKAVAAVRAVETTALAFLGNCMQQRLAATAQEIERVRSTADQSIASLLLSEMDNHLIGGGDLPLPDWMKGKLADADWLDGIKRKLDAIVDQAKKVQAKAAFKSANRLLEEAAREQLVLVQGAWRTFEEKTVELADEKIRRSTESKDRENEDLPEE